MPAAAVLAADLLVAVMVWSAVAKWPHPAETQSSIRLLRLPSILQARWVARALPIGELVLAAVLLFAPGGWLSVVAASLTLALMVTYWLVIARALRFNPRPSCGCFGRIGNQTVTERTLIRNSILVALGAVALAWAIAGHRALPLGDTWWWVVGAAVSAGLAALIVTPVAAPMSVITPIPEPVEEVGEDGMLDYVRTPIRPLVLHDGTNPVSLRELGYGQATLLIFVNCYCSSTYQVLDELPRWREALDISGGPTVAVRMVMARPPEEVRERLPEYDEDWLFDHYAGVWEELGLTASPSAVLLGADGLLAGGPVNGGIEVREMVDEIVENLAGA